MAEWLSIMLVTCLVLIQIKSWIKQLNISAIILPSFLPSFLDALVDHPLHHHLKNTCVLRKVESDIKNEMPVYISEWFTKTRSKKKRNIASGLWLLSEPSEARRYTWLVQPEYQDQTDRREIFIGFTPSKKKKLLVDSSECEYKQKTRLYLVCIV